MASRTGVLVNWSTTVSVERTVNEILRLLRTSGAERVTTVYTARQPVGIEFSLETPRFGWQEYRLPIRPAGVLAAMERRADEFIGAGRTRRRALPWSWCTQERASQVAWRIVKQWVEVQLSLVECSAAPLEEIMFPYMLLPAAGGDGRQRTVFDAAGEFFALPGPGPADGETAAGAAAPR